MRYRCFATDYDGTIAHDGVVTDATTAALRRLRDSGVKVLLVSGRELPGIFDAFPAVADVFDRLVLENGAISYDPLSRQTRLLAPAPPEPFITRLRGSGIPLSVGQSVVSTYEPHGQPVFDAIEELGLDWHVVYNKGAIMALPNGVSKASGLAAALQELGIGPGETVCAGDAENDHAMMQYCGLAMAPANALAAVKADAALVTAAAHGAGVEELIDRWLGRGLDDVPRRAARSSIARG